MTHYAFNSCSLSIGGLHITDDSSLDKVECYSPMTNQWTMCAPMKKRRSQPGVAVVGGMIYVIGGIHERYEAVAP